MHCPSSLLQSRGFQKVDLHSNSTSSGVRDWLSQLKASHGHSFDLVGDGLAMDTVEHGHRRHALIAQEDMTSFARECTCPCDVKSHAFSSLT